MKMYLDRAVGNLQSSANFLVRQSFGNQAHDLMLAVRQVPARDAAAELGRRVRRKHGHAVLFEEGVGVLRREGRGAGDDRLHAREVGGIEVRVEHHAQRGRNQADGARLVAPDRVDPRFDRKPFEQAEGASVADRREDAKQSAQVHHR